MCIRIYEGVNIMKLSILRMGLRMGLRMSLRMSLIMGIILMVSCSNSDGGGTGGNVGNKTIPESIKKNIWYSGDINSNRVLVVVQGGPSYSLENEGLNQIFTGQNINTDNLLIVMPHQHQTITANHSLYDYPDPTKSLPFETIEGYSNQTINILNDTLEHFNDSGYKVYLMGISVGAFIVERFMSTKDINLVDKYLIVVGRLDIPEVFWKAYKEGNAGRFENGITPTIETETDIANQNLWKIAASFGQYRYTEKLAKYDDLSNVTYLYAEKDDAVGGLNATELSFLSNKKVQVIKAPDDYKHEDTFTGSPMKEALKKAFNIE